MNKFFKVLTFACICALCSCGGGSEPVKYVYTENEMYEKIWETNVVHNESIVLKEDKNGDIYGTLMFTPKQVICVRDHTLSKVFSSETDYYVKDDKIYMKQGSTMPYLTQKNLSTEVVPEIFKNGEASDGTYDGKEPGTKILFTEGIGIIFNQVMVSYTHDDAWVGTKPSKKGSKLPKLRTKLSNKEDLNMLTLGDSIFVGCNASGLKGLEPFQDTFPNGFASELQRNFGITVNHTNLSKGGELSNYGADNAGAIATYSPDILVVGFGMNDGSWNVSPQTYLTNIKTIIETTQKDSPKTSIIICATILPSEVSPQSNGNHKDYLSGLLALENDYDDLVVMDMTTFSSDLFKKKYSMDLFANNINHPADWLSRLYVANLMNIIDVEK